MFVTFSAEWLSFEIFYQCFTDVVPSVVPSAVLNVVSDADRSNAK